MVPVGLLSVRCQRTKWQRYLSEGRATKSLLHRSSDEEREVHGLGGHATTGVPGRRCGAVPTGQVGSTHRAHQAGLRAGLRGAVLARAALAGDHTLGGLLTLDLTEKAKKRCVAY